MFFSPFATHKRPIRPEFDMRPNDRHAMGRFTGQQQTDAGHSIQQLPDEDAPSNATSVVVFQQQIQVVSKVELGLSGVIV